MTPRAIPRYDVAGFERLIEASPHTLLSHPCIVQGFVDRWRARTLWVDFDYLTAMFGHHEVTAGAPQFVTHRDAQMCQVKTDYGTYLKYVQEQHLADTLFQDSWIKGGPEQLRDSGRPLYCGNLRLVRRANDPLFDEVSPILPAALRSLNNEIPYFYQCGNHLWLYVSAAGALTPLHQDNNAVCAYLAQLAGRKEATLYSPEDKPHYHNATVGYLDPLAPDEAQFPTWRKAQPWTASLMPGDLLLWGPEWAHHVVTSEQSVTVSFDFVTRDNLTAYARSKDWRFELGAFARRHAPLIRERINDSRVLDGLDAGDEAELGRAVMIAVLRSAVERSSADRPETQTRRSLLSALEG